MGRRQVKTKKTEAIDGDDRISNLPNNLITHILSCLSTKEAVKTSILSRRWKPLWATLPILEFTDADFIPRGDGVIDRTRRKANFTTFIYRFLVQKDPSSIRKFGLHGSQCYDLSQLESWISLAKRRNVHELQLEIYYYQNGSENLPSEDSRMSLLLSIYPLEPCIKCEKDRTFTNKLWLSTQNLNNCFVLEPWTTVVNEWNIEELKLDFSAAEDSYEYAITTFPETFFTWEMLKVLKLEGSDMLLDPPLTSISFPNLKVLHLSKIMFQGSESASNFINSGCPVLEELFMDRQGEDNITDLIVTSRTLKRLTVIFMIEEEGTDKTFKAHIDAPALEYLKIEDEATEEYNLEDCPFVDEANINVHYMIRSIALDLLNKICNVERLTLSAYSMLALQYRGSYNLATFYLLTRLEIVTDDNFQSPKALTWHLVLELLRKSPKLETLLIKEILFGLGEDFMVTSEHDVPNCLESKLKTVKLSFLSFKETELKVVAYTLKNTKALKNLEIRIKGYSTEDKSVETLVFALPKSSSECHIEICGLFDE